VLVSEGDTVRDGQVLAELESTHLQDQVRQAEAAVAQAKANVGNARITQQRNEGLLQRGIAARKEVEDARTQVAVNEAALQQAEASLSLAKTQLSRAQIRAPFAGTVVRRFVGVGDEVDGTAAQPVIEVASIDSLELLGNVPAPRLNRIKVGEDFSFQTDDVPGTSFKASVAAVLPAVDPATNNGTVRIRIGNPKHLLKVGQYLSVALPMSENGTQLVVPKQSIYPDESGEPHVYRVKGNEAESVAVQLGIQTSDSAEVLSGVNDGDTVIVTGGYGLPEKATVRIKQ
jgi:membrane fusion protein (multidrug efflux system)